MDAYDLGQKISKYWAALYPKNSGHIDKPNKKIKVVVYTDDGYREVVGVRIEEDKILLITDGE